MITEPLKFLGALVSRVDVSMGWGGEPGYCNVDLVEDPDNNHFFDPPPLGTACIFKFGKLSFGGIFKRYSYQESSSSGRTYSVVLESPNSLLNGVAVILRDFQGTIYIDDSDLTELWKKPIMTYGEEYPTNIINLYADKENYEFGGIFGGSDTNSMGYPVVNFISDISSAMLKGNFAGKIKFSDTVYDLDLTDLSFAISRIPKYRISSNYSDIATIINDICQKANYDFTFTITGNIDDRGVVVSDSKIKIKLLSKEEVPNKNIIQQVIENFRNKPDKVKDLISFTRGKEYADIVTQKVLIGGKASRYWLADQRYIIPIWGQIGAGRNATYFYGNSLYEYSNPFTQIRVTIDGGYENNFTWVDTNLLELRCAIGGRECWTAYHLLMALKENRTGITFGNFQITQEDFVKLLQGNLGPNDLCDTSVDNGVQYALWLYGPDVAQQTYAQRTINARFSSIKAAADNFYGKSFLVEIPGEIGPKENSFRWVNLDKQYESSWDTANSAWAGDDSVLDFPDTKFYDNDGKLQSVAIYPNLPNADYSGLGNRYALSRLGTNNGALIDANIDTDWGIRWFDKSVIYQIDKSGSFRKDSRGNKVKTVKTAGYVKVDIEQIDVYDSYSTFHNGFNMLCRLILGVDLLPGNHNLFGFSNLDFAMPPSRLAPEYIGIPQESKRYVWGPWFAFNEKAGQIGKVEISEDSEMRPEAFGSIAKMNEFANDFVKTDLASLIESESGEVEIAEEPGFDLAERFYANGPYVTNMSITADANGGFKTSYRFSTWTTNFGEMSKYNIGLFRKQKAETYRQQKEINALFRNKPGKPITASVFGQFERKMPKRLPSSNFIAGNMFNSIANAINAQGKELGVNVSAVTMEEGMRTLGLNPLESFGATMEQLYTPIFLYNQNKLEEVKSTFNEALIEEPEQ